MKIHSRNGTPSSPERLHKDSYSTYASAKALSVSSHGGPRILHYTVGAQRPPSGTSAQVKKSLWQKIHSLPAYAVIVLVFSSFVCGVWLTWSTHNSQAGVLESAPAPASTSSVPGSIPIRSDAPLLAESDKVSEQNVLTMTMEQLENYLQVATTTPEKQAAEIMRMRTMQLRAYLERKGSPLALFADTIAGLKHWRLVLAISNSESSLGRRCADNNCSGIGVMPGHPLWRRYETKAEWAKDLDRLIERRYKNWSLEKMNGVYNQPGSENWVYAARQILEDLQPIP